MMKESFLQYIWLHHVRANVKYRTVSGQEFTILYKGMVNTDAGADMQNVRIRKEGVEWYGSVEFHVKSSDWERHRHFEDKAYNNVLLHFVAEYDQESYTENGRKLPIFIFPGLMQYYQTFEHTFAEKRFVYCEKHVAEIPDFVKNMCLQRLVISRLERKTKAVFQLLLQNKNSWEDISYQVFARYFGQKLNGDAFEQLARKTPQTILAKHKNSVFQLEALLLGQAGMLAKQAEDDYTAKLQREYHFLQTKYNLQPMDATEWKFLRLRPANFPPLRIAQLASLLYHSEGLFSKILHTETVKEYRKLFEFGVSDYWKSHYILGKETARKSNRKLGIVLQNTLLINGVVPLLFAYSKYVGEEYWQEKALDLLQELDAERNFIVSGFQQLGFSIDNAYTSQSAIELHQEYCVTKRCEQCLIGHEILKQRYDR